MIFGDRTDGDERVQVIFVRHITVDSEYVYKYTVSRSKNMLHALPMPSDDVERSVVLLAGEVLPTQFVYNCVINQLKHVPKNEYDQRKRTIPRRLINIKMCDWMFKITDVSETVSTQRSELRELVVRSKDLLDI